MATLSPGCAEAPDLRRRYRLALLPLALLAASATGQEHTPAVLKLREVDFFYRSRIAPFTCTDLQGRVASILRALGARDDVDVKVSGCDAVISPMEPVDTQQSGSSGRWGTANNRWQTASDPFARNQRNGREQSAHVRVRMMMPVEVTPEVLAELEKDKARRELVSRVTGNPAASFNDPIVFAARRQEVTLSRRTVDLEPDECELLEQMSASIFRDLDIRVVQPGPRCDRYSISQIPPQAVVEALMPIMPSAPQAAPAPEETETGEDAEAGQKVSGDAPTEPAVEPKPE